MALEHPSLLICNKQPVPAKRGTDLQLQRSKRICPAFPKKKCANGCAKKQSKGTADKDGNERGHGQNLQLFDQAPPLIAANQSRR